MKFIFKISNIKYRKNTEIKLATLPGANLIYPIKNSET